MRALSSLTGTARLLRTMLRRDRFRTLGWVAGLGLLGFYFAHAVQTVVGDQEELRSIASLYADPVGRMMVGPGFGMDDPTLERFYAGGYALYLFIGAALMSIFTVVRHTRAEEQTGRAELLRAAVVGRHATLTAALLLTGLLNLLVALLVWAGALTAGYAQFGSALVALATFASGTFFAGVAAITAQLGESARGASAIAGALLGVAFLLRMGGDAAEMGGSALSWSSPLGWAQQTAPYVHDEWWPLLLLAGGGLCMGGLGYWLSTRRDVDAGLLSTPLGRAEASPRLGTPLGTAARSLRGGLCGWGIALVLAALMFGAYAQAVVDAAGDLPPELAQVFGGEDMMLGYMSFIVHFLAVFAAAAGVSAVQQVRGEEARGRAEFGLSAPISRTGWLGAHVAVILAGVLSILALVGAGTALGAAVALEDDGWSHFWDLFASALLQAPAVLAAVGITVAVFGWLPRAAGAVGWAVVGFAAVMSTFGELLDLPEAVLNLNLFGHLAEYPAESVEWVPFIWLLAIASTGAVLGLLGWRRREVGRI